MIDKTNFAKKLVELRNKCGLSQSKLADMLYVSGQAVSKWETANSLPDIELLLPLSQILGASVDYLLGSGGGNFENSGGVMKEAIAAYDVSDGHIGLLSAMSGSLSREYLYKAAKYIEKDTFEYRLSLELTSCIDDAKNCHRREVDLREFDKDALSPFAKQLANLTIQAVNSGYNPVLDILALMKCPECGKDFEYFKDTESEYISCGEHRFDVNEGVVDFKTLEIHGYTWSSWLRCYDDYKQKFCPKTVWDPKSIDDFGDFDKNYIRELQKSKPPVILDIGSGVASGIKKFAKAIDWDCTVILTDLSHRILKYSKRHIDENMLNAHVKFVYLACDVKNLPFKDGSVPCILSYGGYCSVSYGFKESIIESRRVLKTNGKIMTDMGIISDREDKNAQKWLKLITDGMEYDSDFYWYHEQIYDVKEWHELIKEFGFTDFAFIKTRDEEKAPDTDKFPYDYEIARWMGLAFISMTKSD